METHLIEQKMINAGFLGGNFGGESRGAGARARNVDVSEVERGEKRRERVTRLRRRQLPDLIARPPTLWRIVVQNISVNLSLFLLTHSHTYTLIS